MKVIYSGLESSGKSLRLAMLATDLVKRNSKWYKESGQIRSILSNLRFSDSFTKFAEDLGVPIIYYSHLHELVKYKNVDVIMDEVGNYFDSRLWADLSLDVRSWLSQGAKSGIELYGSAQDFAQIDKSFRRLCNYLFEVKKVVGSRRPSPTKPPVGRVWGLCLLRELNPISYSEDDKKYISFFPDFFFISKEYCDIFDTTQKIPRSDLIPFRHTERYCEDENCPLHGVKGGKAKIVHY